MNLKQPLLIIEFPVIFLNILKTVERKKTRLFH